VNNKARVSHPLAIEKWKLPPRGTMKLNWDVVINKNKKLMGIEIVVQDFTSEVVAI
jgi:hypothetical protein